MDAEEFERFVASKYQRAFELEPYKEYIVSKLREHPDTPSTVIHDKLKEYFVNFPDVHSKTVYNYVMKLRGEYGMPKVSASSRQYSPVPDMPPGAQAQVDFGEKKLRTGTGNYVTVYFFAMVLCYSRYKFVFFRDKKFTSHSAVEAHEKAFEFYDGIPREIIYDQDCVFIRDENRGDYVMTDAFSRYQSSRPFKVTFCRAADPESKGKVENVVKYVKNNFLYNRQFTDVNILNSQAMEWLERTGNKMVHNTTRKVPVFQWKHERQHMLAWHPIFTAPATDEYKVYKTNVIKYKGNSYSLPFGTYRGEDHRVSVNETDGSIVIRDLEEDRIIATHMIPEGKGHNIINTNHRRNTSIRLNDLREKVRGFFRHSSSVEEFISVIERLYPRYVRDRLTTLLTASEKVGVTGAEIALDYCLSNNITSCNDFKAVVDKFAGRHEKTAKPAICKAAMSDKQPIRVKPMGDASVQLISRSEPDKSDIAEYESLFTNIKNKPL